MEVEVVPQLLHLQRHQLRPLHQVTIETLTGVTEAGPQVQLDGAAAAVVLLTVHTHMLRDRWRRLVIGGDRDRPVK